MPILNPTAATGASAKPGPMVTVDPARLRSPDAFERLIDGELNATFITDVLSDMTAHERAGAHLYRSVTGRTLNPVLEERYHHFGEETTEHVEILEDLVSELGGDPRYVSSSARATEKSGTSLVESTFLLGGSIDALTRELVMLEAVFLAEAKDHANWESLRQMASLLPDNTRRPAEDAVERVLAQEEEHLEWARTARSQLLLTLAGTPAPPPEVTPTPELVERIRGLLA